MPANGRRDLIRRLKVKGEIECRVHSPTNALFYFHFKKRLKFILKYKQISLLHVSVFDHHQGAFALNLAKVIFILQHSVKLRRYLLCSCMTACHGMACVLYAVQNSTRVAFCTAYNILQHTRIGYEAKWARQSIWKL